MGFPRQEYRRGLPFPSAGDLPNTGKLSNLSLLHWRAGSLPLTHHRRPWTMHCYTNTVFKFWSQDDGEASAELILSVFSCNTCKNQVKAFRLHIRISLCHLDKVKGKKSWGTLPLSLMITPHDLFTAWGSSRPKTAMKVEVLWPAGLT